MTQRNELFRTGLCLLQEINPATHAMLSKHVFNLKFGEEFVIKDQDDLIELVQALNTWHQEQESCNKGEKQNGKRFSLATENSW